MAGPNIQQPQALSPMLQPDSELPSVEYATFFNSLQIIAFYSTRSGTTAQRLTASSMGRWPGMAFFDTTLGKPVFLKEASSNVWVDATGTPV